MARDCHETFAVNDCSILNDAGLNMILTSQSRDLADRLLAWEADAGESSESKHCAALRVYDKLRRRLCVLAGVAGFHSLASRALTIAKSEAPDLADVQVAADGTLHGLGAPIVQTGIESNNENEGETVLIAWLLSLLLTFLGEALTWNLISDLWPAATLDNAFLRTGE